MAYNTAVLKVTDENSVVSRFPMMPTDQGGRGWVLQTRPWEPGDPATRWRIPLHPWTGGVNVDRLKGTPTHSKANADTSNDGLLLFPPLLNSVTLTNGSSPSKTAHFDSLTFVIGGRYVYYFDPVTNAATEDKDLGASKAAVDIAVFNNELIVAMGETEKIWKRSIGVNTSGTANVAVTSDATSLTDTRLALSVNAYVGATVTCNAKTMVVTSNTATVFTGASWSGGGNPGNGNAWSVAGTWTQASDATYAIALGVVDNKLWRAETTNRLSSCATTPLTLTNWTPASPNQYYAGDSTYAINTIVDYGGIPWIGKADGMWAPDPQSRFKNQTPQLRASPDATNCKGAFTAHGYLWVPSVSGLFRIRPGESKKRGPELTMRPGYRFRVRGGVEWGEAIYLLVTDDAAAGNTVIYKMVRDLYGISGREYLYYEWCQLDGTTATGRAITVNAAGTNPKLVTFYGNNLRYITMGRGGGRDIDDPNYAFGTAMSLETGVMMPGPDLAVVSNLIGVDTVLDYSRAGESLTVAYAMDRLTDTGSFTNLLTTAEGGGTAAITGTTNFQRVSRYAAANVSGQFLEVQFTGALTSASGTTRPVIREAWAYGYSHPTVTDIISIALASYNNAWANGMQNAKSRMEAERMFRDWMNRGVELTCEIEGYEVARTTRFVVGGVEITNQAVEPGITGYDSNAADILKVMLIRCDHAGVFAT